MVPTLVILTIAVLLLIDWLVVWRRHAHEGAPLRDRRPVLALARSSAAAAAALLHPELTRVRVEGFSKINATMWPSSGRSSSAMPLGRPLRASFIFCAFEMIEVRSAGSV